MLRCSLDANILVYHFEPHPILGPACHQLIQSIENDEVRGLTSTHVLSEVAHRLMAMEASLLPGWSTGKVVQRLRQKPAVLQSLARFRSAVESILQSRIEVLTITPPLIATAAAISQQTGLLTNDALIVAVMQDHGLTNLASHDSDFDRVPGLTRYAPA
ncbi:MAG: type II toxin-antitoxin system VapC family toxin [Pirellulales bacterium]